MARIKHRKRADDGFSYQVCRVLGGGAAGAGVKERAGAFASLNRAQAFKLDVENAGNRWPEGWVTGEGYVDRDGAGSRPPPTVGEVTERFWSALDRRVQRGRLKAYTRKCGVAGRPILARCARDPGSRSRRAEVAAEQLGGESLREAGRILSGGLDPSRVRSPPRVVHSRSATTPRTRRRFSGTNRSSRIGSHCPRSLVPPRSGGQIALSTRSGQSSGMPSIVR